MTQHVIDTNRPSTADDAPADAAHASAADERLSHLFRASLKSGRIHPLYLPLVKYRHARFGT